MVIDSLLDDASLTAGTVAPPHPRTIGWLGTTALAMGGSNQSLFLIGALIAGQGSAAVPLLIVGLLLSWAAAPGWTELILMWPNRVGGIAATCAEAFRPYSPVLANLTGFCYWWGWVPTCGLTAILSATAITDWYLPGVPVPLLASALVLFFTIINLYGVRWVTRLALPLAAASAALAFLSGLIPLLSGHVNWPQATTFHLVTPFHGLFGQITSAMAGLYLIGFAAPAFEAATCHVGETVDPTRNVPRAMFASGLMAAVYFVALPVLWLGVLGPTPLMGDLAQTLGPTFAPLLGSAAHAAAIWFMMFNMFHGTLQPLAGAARTLMQLAEDGLLPRVLSRRNRADAPWVATVLTAGMAILFLLGGDPVWVIAAANLCYLIGVALPSVAVWLLRKNAPTMARPYRAPRGTIILGLLAAGVWGLATILGFEQFGLPTVLASMALAYSGSALYAWRRWSDRRRAGVSGPFWRSLHLKLTGAMLLVLTLDGAGYLLAVYGANKQDAACITLLEDIFVAVALLTITVGLVLPGMIGHAVSEVAHAADHLATSTLADFARAMRALSVGDLDAAHARAAIVPVAVRSRDEVGAMATSFNTMQAQIAQAAVALDGAREDLRQAREELTASNTQLTLWSTALEHRVEERTAALQESTERFRLLFTHSPQPMWVYAVQTRRFLEVNDAAISLYGYTRDEFLQMCITEIRPPDDIGRLQEFMDSPRPIMRQAGEWRHRLKSGRLIDVEVTSHTLDFDGEEAVLVLAQDITARKRAEEARRAQEAAERANQAKSEFLSRMSHELRTPLNAILGFAQILEMDTRDAEQEESVRHILKAGHHLLGLINEVLDITRIEAGRLDLSLEPVCIREVLQEVQDLVGPLAAARGVRWDMAAIQACDRCVQADRQRLAQVVLNLLSNAIKYNVAGGTVTVSWAEAQPERLRLMVRDTGLGIPADKLGRLFTPFDRLGAEQSGVEGTGIGLTLSKSLVEAMGGVVGLESTVGQGSLFWVELPEVAEPAAQVAAPAMGPPALATAREQRVILSIEDNLSNQQLTERLFAAHAHVTLLSAIQGQRGLELARAHVPDLILLDVHLPDMLGDEVLRELRDHPATRAIPVLVLSADATPRQKERLTAAGAQAYLTKPLDIRKFQRTVDLLLEKEAS